MKTIGQVLLIALFLLLVMLTNQVQAQVIHTLENFDAIAATGNIEVILEQSDNNTVTINAENIPADEVKVRVKNGLLKLSLVNSIFYKNDRVKVLVSHQQILKSIKAHAGANISSNDVIEGESLFAKATSGAELQLRLQVQTLEASAFEGGIVVLEGETGMQTINVGTGGKFKGFDLSAKNTIAKANTGGKIEATAMESIEASANTGGSIEYSGNPEESTTKTIISGNIKKI